MKISNKIKDDLYKEGFTEVIKYLRKTDKNHIFIVRKKGKTYFIKITYVLEFFDNLVNEVKANVFINKIKPKSLPLIIPYSSLIKRDKYVIGVFEYVDKKSLANQDSLKIIAKIRKNDLENIFQIEKFFFSIKKTKIPKYFYNKNKSNHTYNDFKEKICSYLEEPINKQIISKEDKNSLLKNIKNLLKIQKRCYQHQDLVLWNMLKVGDKIVLVDSEYARWGIRWFDISYFFIQTYIALESPELAIKSLKYFIKRFKEELPNINIEKEIILPLSYRITPNLKEAIGSTKKENLAKKLLAKILTGDINKIIESN